MYVYIYIYIYICIYIYIYIYICVSLSLSIYIYIYFLLFVQRQLERRRAGSQAREQEGVSPRRYQTRHFRKRATSVPAEGPPKRLDLARRCEFPFVHLRLRACACARAAEVRPDVKLAPL